MSTPQQELGLLTPEPLIELYEVDLRNIGSSLILYFSNSRSHLDVRLGGIVYNPWPLKVSKYGSSLEGSLPNPTVTLSNYQSVIIALLDFHQPRGAIFRRRRILRRNLDDGSDPNPSAQYQPDEFFLDKWIERGSYVILSLESALAYVNREIPARSLVELRTGS